MTDAAAGQAQRGNAALEGRVSAERVVHLRPPARAAAAWVTAAVLDTRTTTIPDAPAAA